MRGTKMNVIAFPIGKRKAREVNRNHREFLIKGNSIRWKFNLFGRFQNEAKVLRKVGCVMPFLILCRQTDNEK